MVSVQFHKRLSGSLLGARDIKINKRASAHMHSQASRGDRENQAMGQA